MPVRKAASWLVWRLPSRRHSSATPRLLRSLNVTAMSVSPNPKIPNASALVNATGYLIPQVDIRRPVRVRWYRIPYRNS